MNSLRPFSRSQRADGIECAIHCSFVVPHAAIQVERECADRQGLHFRSPWRCDLISNRPAMLCCNLSLPRTTAHGDGSPPNLPELELIARVGSGSYGEVWVARN